MTEVGLVTNWNHITIQINVKTITGFILFLDADLLLGGKLNFSCPPEKDFLLEGSRGKMLQWKGCILFL